MITYSGALRAIERTLVAAVDMSRRYAWPVVAAAAIITVLLALYTANNIRMNTDTGDVLSRDLPFRQQMRAFKAVFPAMRDPLVIVLDGPNTDAVEYGALALSGMLRKAPDLFGDVLYPEGDPFFEKNGLLYLSPKELDQLTDRLAQMQPFLATLTNDPTLRGLFELLRTALEQGGGALAEAEGMRDGLDEIAAVIEQHAAGRTVPFAWNKLMAGEADPAQRRRLVVAQTKVEVGSLRPAGKALEYVRLAAQQLGLVESNGVRLRLTGDAALDTQELESVFSGATLASGLSFVLVAILVVIGMHSLRMVVAVMATMTIGLLWTAAFAAAAVGSLNLISVAFAVLFVGIAVDFGIHFALRYKEQRLRDVAHAQALRNTAMGVGPSLLLAGVAAMIAFFSFLPTSFTGIAELGLIAGGGMVIAVFTSLTLLPAIISVLPHGPMGGPARLPRAAALEAFVRNHARPITIAVAGLAVAVLPLLSQVRFEKNPLNLQDPTKEAVLTLRDLMRDDPSTRPSISVLAPNLAAAEELAKRAKPLESVAGTTTAADLVPTDQERKLDVIGQMNLFLAPLFVPMRVAQPPSAEEQRAAADGFVVAADKFAASPQAGPLKESIGRLAAAVRSFMSGPGRSYSKVDALEGALLDGLREQIDKLGEALEARKVTLDDVPEALRRQYLAPDGRARVEILPRADLFDDVALRQFVSEVTAVFPTAIGPPVQLVASGDAVSKAFVQASIIAVIVITIFLFVLLRSALDVVFVLTPLALAATLTFAISATLGPPLNFANIIVLPLLLGLGVSSGIYLVTRAREERHGLLLRTITPRAVFFSALTTIASFGSLAVSGHKGMASMGELLLIAITLSLVCTLVVLPALLALRYGKART